MDFLQPQLVRLEHWLFVFFENNVILKFRMWKKKKNQTIGILSMMGVLISSQMKKLYK